MTCERTGCVVGWLGWFFVFLFSFCLCCCGELRLFFAVVVLGVFRLVAALWFRFEGGDRVLVQVLVCGTVIRCGDSEQQWLI